MLEKILFIVMAAVLAVFFFLAVALLACPHSCTPCAGAAIVQAYFLLAVFSTSMISMKAKCIYATATIILCLLLLVFAHPLSAVLTVDLACLIYVAILHVKLLGNLRGLARMHPSSMILSDSPAMLLSVIVLAFSCLVIPIVMASGTIHRSVAISCDIVLLAIFSFLYFRFVTGRHLFIPAIVVSRLEALVPSGNKKKLPKNKQEKLRSVFSRICDFMENEQPYLDPALSKADVAKAVYSNKTYVGIAVGTFSDKNFCNFVNAYRVQYAMDRFMENPSLRVGQIALMSGFRNKSSFSVAFKLVTDMTPNDWCIAYREQMKI